MLEISLSSYPSTYLPSQPFIFSSDEGWGGTALEFRTVWIFQNDCGLPEIFFIGRKHTGMSAIWLSNLAQWRIKQNLNTTHKKIYFCPFEFWQLTRKLKNKEIPSDLIRSLAGSLLTTPAERLLDGRGNKVYSKVWWLLLYLNAAWPVSDWALCCTTSTTCNSLTAPGSAGWSHHPPPSTQLHLPAAWVLNWQYYNSTMSG